MTEAVHGTATALNFASIGVYEIRNFHFLGSEIQLQLKSVTSATLAATWCNTGELQRGH